jgi:excinuclease ABC subunit A
MAEKFIHIRGAKVHNLKNVEVKLPREKLIVFTGVSGSGKSSLAFDTLYAEGQRRYLESLSSYARQFLMNFDKPEVEHISGLSPTIAIEQRTASHNPRSTVGTVTEIHDYLRVLYARVGIQHCVKCGKPVGKQTVDNIVDSILAYPEASRIYLLAPIISGRKGEYKDVFAAARTSGFARVRVNGRITSLEEEITLDKKRKHDIEIVVDRLRIEPSERTRLAESVETALREGNGVLHTLNADSGEERVFSLKLACTECAISYEELTPQMFSFNNPAGMCESCGGLGLSEEVDLETLVPDPALSIREGAVRFWGLMNGRASYMQSYLDEMLHEAGANLDTPWNDLPEKAQKAVIFGAKWRRRGRMTSYEGVANSIKRLYHETQSEGARRYYAYFFANNPCGVCCGKRLSPQPLAVRVGGMGIGELADLPVTGALEFFAKLKLKGASAQIAVELVKEIRARLQFMSDVGLGYLTLSRSAPSLSGGESQRIRLASQIGSGLTGVLYVLDEPSIGLHSRDNKRLLNTLIHLRDIGNTIVVVEHDREAMETADLVVDFGPGAGLHGGEIVGMGTAAELAREGKTLTGKYLSGKLRIEAPKVRRDGNGKAIEITGARANNLKRIRARFPIGKFIAVTGVSGSGKSSLVNETLHRAAYNIINKSLKRAGSYDKISGVTENIDHVIRISQKPIGRTPRSNPATYTGVWDPIRKLYSELPESRVRGYQPGRFSFNVKGGRCEACQGDGVKKVELHFLPDVYVKCEECCGRRFNRETLTVTYKGKSIFDVLEMTVAEAMVHFSAIPPIARVLQTLSDVGLEYIHLGQPAPTLSGGESQRVKLAKELTKRSLGRTLYLLDEPTTGLHFEDIRKLLNVLNRLADAGNTIVVIEHNLDVIKCADWVIDLGPEGGEEGGRVIAEGTPEDIAHAKESYTGKYLKKVLNRRGS